MIPDTHLNIYSKNKNNSFIPKYTTDIKKIWN